MSLAQARPGQRVKVVEIMGGWGLARRLMGLGLTPGCVLRVLSGIPGGPLLVEVEGLGVKTSIGRGMAHKILVEPLD